MLFEAKPLTKHQLSLAPMKLAHTSKVVIISTVVIMDCPLRKRVLGAVRAVA